VTELTKTLRKSYDNADLQNFLRTEQVCNELPTSADNTTLLAFAAEHHAAVALGSCHSWLISPAHWAHSSKPTAVACSD